MNRVLILGSSRVALTDLAKHVVSQMSNPVDWTLVTSYENIKLRWADQVRVKRSLLAKEVPSDSPQGLEDQVIMDNVVSNAVLSKPWVQKLVAEGRSFICTTTNPLQFISLNQIFEFDSVLISSKTSKLKLLQFAHALIKNDTIKQTTFMDQAGGMNPNNFMSVHKDGSFSIMNMLGSTPSYEEKKPVHPAMETKRKPTYYRPDAASVQDLNRAIKEDQQKDKTAVLPSMEEPEHLKTFKIEKTPADDEIKLWVNIETVEKDKEKVERCLETLKGALQEKLIMNLFQESFIEQFETKKSHKILLCFYVQESNLDLFSVLLLRVLRALRSGHHIRRGGIFF